MATEGSPRLVYKISKKKTIKLGPEPARAQEKGKE